MTKIKVLLKAAATISIICAAIITAIAIKHNTLDVTILTGLIIFTLNITGWIGLYNIIKYMEV